MPLGYTKTTEAKITRIKHSITFQIGQQAIDFKYALSEVPAKALVHDIFIDEETELAQIIFIEEIEKK